MSESAMSTDGAVQHRFTGTDPDRIVTTVIDRDGRVIDLTIAKEWENRLTSELLEGAVIAASATAHAALLREG